MKIMVTTYPFGDPNDTPVRQLRDYNVAYNDVGRKYTSNELRERLVRHKPEIIIAGTEKYTSSILDLVPDLKMISRVGIGVDSVDLEECKKREIIVTNTPDAPSNAVAEMVICQMINMLRKIQLMDGVIRDDRWSRFVGRDLRDCDIGIIGCGRIGQLMVEKLQGMKPRRIFVNDIIPEKMRGLPRTEPANKMQIFAGCHIITVHIPYEERNHHYVSKREFDLMKGDAILINTSRGGIVDEKALYEWLVLNKEAAAAIDTFEREPYKGELRKLENTYLTPHLGSCTRKSRFDMEVGAVEEVLNLLQNKGFNSRII